MKSRIVPVAAASRGDVVFVPLADGVEPDAGPSLRAALQAAGATGDAKGTFRSVAVFHQPAKSPCKRLATVGLGKASQVDTEKLRRAAAVAQQQAAELGVASFGLVVAKAALGGCSLQAAGAAIAEGLALGAYRYDPPRQKPAKDKKANACLVGLVGFAGKDERAFRTGFAAGAIAAAATVFARDLENLPANLCTPTMLAKAAKGLAGGRLRVKVLDEKACAKLGMGSFLGVAQGATEPPRFLVLEYRVPGAKGNACVVGKGLTFDTGGISIKPAAKMDEMRYDMCGAGAVLGLFHALAHGGLGAHRPKCNIVGLIAATENAVGPDAQKPGDVVRAMDGQTIEVLNTDAEGRLVLADAMCYAKKFFAPKQMVDLATLTGAVVTALGHEVAAVMGNDQALCDALVAAGKAADEPLWQLPLWDCHKEQMKSKFADLANINGAQYGNGSIAGGAFLAFFAGDTPWVHLDIAGTAYGGLAKDYYRSGAAGTAVRTLLHWVRSL
ncbi:MAG: leucyl aminopeptidase [Planctomycetes bacterium]|nr:leucyl aminopeptidase [Planctomycetota bacterium]